MVSVVTDNEFWRLRFFHWLIISLITLKDITTQGQRKQFYIAQANSENKSIPIDTHAVCIAS